MSELWIDASEFCHTPRRSSFSGRWRGARIAGAIEEDVLLLVEHPPVVTLGRSAKEKNLLASPQLLAARGVELFEVERGGDVTFHGPGQLVGYPIIDLKRHKRDLHWYLRQVEEALIDALGALGIEAERSAGFTGVWTHGPKDRVDRRPRARLGDVAWLRAQRVDGPELLRPHGPLRHRGGDDDVRGAGIGPKWPWNRSRERGSRRRLRNRVRPRAAARRPPAPHRPPGRRERSIKSR